MSRPTREIRKPSRLIEAPSPPPPPPRAAKRKRKPVANDSEDEDEEIQTQKRSKTTAPKVDARPSPSPAKRCHRSPKEIRDILLDLSDSEEGDKDFMRLMASTKSTTTKISTTRRRDITDLALTLPTKAISAQKSSKPSSNRTKPPGKAVPEHATTVPSQPRHSRSVSKHPAPLPKPSHKPPEASSQALKDPMHSRFARDYYPNPPADRPHHPAPTHTKTKGPDRLRKSKARASPPPSPALADAAKDRLVARFAEDYRAYLDGGPASAVLARYVLDLMQGAIRTQVASLYHNDKLVQRALDGVEGAYREEIEGVEKGRDEEGV